MHHAFGVAFIVAAIAFAFGERTARACVGAGLIAGALGFLYIMFRIVTETV
jgi:hypothetical protein